MSKLADCELDGAKARRGGPMTQLIDTGPISSLSRPAGNGVARWYFPVVFGLLFAGMLFGFSETFFLRSLFRVVPIPFYLYVHGGVLTTWFVLVLVQTCLIAAHRQDIHRRLGIVALAVAVVLVPLNIFVVAHAAERAHGVITPLLKLETLGDLLESRLVLGPGKRGRVFSTPARHTQASNGRLVLHDLRTGVCALRACLRLASTAAGGHPARAARPGKL